MIWLRKKIDIIPRIALPSLIIKTKVGKNYVYQMQCVVEDERILIGDILPLNTQIGRCENRGYGSRMMIWLLEYAKENGIEELYGNLSTVDLDHRDRLEHFYEKFGFTITVFDEVQGNYYGEIRKML